MSARRVVTIDCDYMMPRFAASYLLVDGGEAAFIDNNTAHAVPKLLAALKAEGLKPEDVRYVIITHVHLDHAGGTSALMAACPRAQLLCHPRAAPHVIDPTRLVGSARKVYGDQQFEKLYGVIVPVAAERVKIQEEGAVVPFGGAPLQFWHTRGHANHHMCIFDGALGAVFAGDAFGLRYPALQEHGLFIFPSTSPTDFHAEEARRSIERIAGGEASVAYLTHYGVLQGDEIQDAADQLTAWIDFSDDLRGGVEQGHETLEMATERCLAALSKEVERVAAERGLVFTSRHWDVMKLDLELNAQGLAWVGVKARVK